MARAAAADGAGDPWMGGLMTGDGLAGTADGLGCGLALTGVGVATGEGLGEVVAGEPLGRTLGLTTGLVLGLAAGVELAPGVAAALALGAALGAALGDGRAGTLRTYRLIPAVFRVGPIAMAWLPLDGDRTSELGTVGRLARPREMPASGAQSGSSPVGQTFLTLAVTSDTPLGPLVTTQVTSESTTTGVIWGPDEVVTPIPLLDASATGGALTEPDPSSVGPTMTSTRTRAKPLSR